MKPKWLDRRVAAPGPYLALCLSEEEFTAAMRYLKVKSPPEWRASDRADATMHTFTSPNSLTCVVALSGWPGREPVEVAGLLVHEAVHVWQQYAESIGERRPGDEQEAYAIQAIAQELMADFARRMRE